MTKHADFHSGKGKFIKGKLPLERKLDGFDFNKTYEHNINTSYLEKNESVNVEKRKKQSLKARRNRFQKHLKTLMTNTNKKKIENLIRLHKAKDREDCISRVEGKLQEVL